ncbi:MAG TPA: hypothetical protein VET51_08120 [Burkholderiales bacterium]|nr:hypothetical protein [Burkholderiales bacterium]
MTHGEFRSAFGEGRIRVSVDRARAVRLMSARLMLPFILLPLFGAAVALALTGAWLAGGLVFVLAVVLRYVVRASSQGMVLTRALQSAEFYRDAVASGVLSIES